MWDERGDLIDSSLLTVFAPPPVTALLLLPGCIQEADVG